MDSRTIHISNQSILSLYRDNRFAVGLIPGKGVVQSAAVCFLKVQSQRPRNAQRGVRIAGTCTDAVMLCLLALFLSSNEGQWIQKTNPLSKRCVIFDSSFSAIILLILSRIRILQLCNIRQLFHTFSLRYPDFELKYDVFSGNMPSHVAGHTIFCFPHAPTTIFLKTSTGYWCAATVHMPFYPLSIC